METKNATKPVLAGLWKGGLYRLLYMAFVFVSGLLIAVISGANVFGTISLMIANAAILQIITGLGTDSSLVWHGSGGGFNRQKLFSFAFLTGLLQIGLFVAVSFVVVNLTGKLLLSWQPSSSLFGYELMYFAGIVFTEKYASLLYAEEKAPACNKVLSIAALLVFVFLGLLYLDIIPLGTDIIRVFCCISLVPAFALMLYYHFQPSGGLFAKFSREDLRSFFHFSIIVFITNLIQFIAYRADYWFIDLFRDTEQVGVYAQASRFAQLLWVIPTILAGLLAPMIATGNFDKIRMLMLARVLSYINLLLIGLLVLVSWMFYTYFLGPDFFAGFKSLLLMMPGYYFFCLNILLAAWFSARRLLWINFAGSSICLALILLADLLLIPAVGINGAALANSIAYSAAGFFHLWMFMRKTQTGLAEFFRFDKTDWRGIIKLQP